MVMLLAVCIGIVAYIYFGYPALLSLGVLGPRKPIQRFSPGATPAAPLISIIVAAHNEESQIAAKLDNLFASEYPREQTEILIGSDGSSDATEAIVRQFAHEGVGLLSFPQQQGKSAMQNRLVAAASGEFLILTDADCFFAADAIPIALENFSDPSVGLVTARPRCVNERDTAVTENESLYLCYETWLRRQESDRGLLAMASGSFVAIRRSLWRPLDPRLGDDFVLPLRFSQSGLCNVLDERIGVTTHLSENHPRAMLRTKTRIISKDFRCLLAHSRLLNPFRFGALAIALWSHKLLRWLVPYFLLAAFAMNLALLARPAFRFTLILQAAFYATAVIGFLAPNRIRGVPSVPMSFCLVNAAALLGTLRCLTGRSGGRWTPQRISSSAISLRSAHERGELK